MKLTKTVIDSFVFEGASRSSKDVRWDDEVKGFGVRVWPTGAKTFFLTYRHRGRQRFMTLGRYGELTLQQARELARTKKYEAGQGSDPLNEKRQGRRNKLFRELAAEYLKRHAAHKKSVRDLKYLVEAYSVPTLGHLHVDAVTRADVARLHAKVGEKSPVRANRLVAMLSKMFNLAKTWGYLDERAVNPATGIDRFREMKRDRFVTREEFPKLAASIDACPNQVVKGLIWMYLLTGMRKTELMRLRWADVDLARGEIRLPDTKAGRVHYLPLTTHMARVLLSMPRFARNPYVFPGRKAGEPIAEVNKAWGVIRARAGLNDVRIHDLRRTVGSWLAMGGSSLPLIGKILNHSNSSTTQIYARFQLDPAKKVLEEHGAEIAALIAAGEKDDAAPETVDAEAKPVAHVEVS